MPDRPTSLAVLPATEGRIVLRAHCEGRLLLSVSQRRWALYCRLFHNVPSTCAFTHAPSTIRSRSRNGAPPRWQHRPPPRWLLLLPTLLYSPPHANRRGVQLQYGNMEQQQGTHPEGEGGVQYKEASKVSTRPACGARLVPHHPKSCFPKHSKRDTIKHTKNLFITLFLAGHAF